MSVRIIIDSAADIPSEQTAIGVTIGTHVGPGVIAAAFFGKKV